MLHNTQPGYPAPLYPPEILCCIINISPPRVGVNGPMLKLTFISFIHPAKSAAMKQPGSQKCPFEDALWFTLCNAARSLSWPFSSLKGGWGFRIHAWDISSGICWFYQDGEKAAGADIWSFHTINQQSGRENWEYFFILKIMSEHLKFDRKLLGETKLHS